MDDTQRALAYLRRDPILYINLLEVLRRGSGELLWAAEDGVLLHDRGSGSYLFSARNQAAASRIFHLLPPDCELMTGHEMWYYEELKARFGYEGREIVYSMVWTKDAPPEVPGFGGELRLLGPEWAEWVEAHYTNSFAGVPYIAEAIGRGMLGAFVDGRPAGFAGFHDEGSIGMLEVLPGYRRRGIGEALECGMIRLALEKGQYAFGQVVTDNRPSLVLQEKMGMTRSKEPLFWLFP